MGATASALMKAALMKLGAGLTVGGLMGLAGTVGVTLASAGVATDKFGEEVEYCGWVGRWGVTVGAAVGGYLSSLFPSGLSGMFMGLCAATIPAGLYLKQLVLFMDRKSPVPLCLIITVMVVTSGFQSPTGAEETDETTSDHVRPRQTAAGDEHSSSVTSGIRSRDKTLCLDQNLKNQTLIRTRVQSR
ncbi:uncharacterized protein AKAME5_002034100 [Lates japonicus]|uniref:Uncharacterized protein n=1 Tax=Lates japonicus TaxID=270547 RepID=A0AAD3N9G7_LATJO|nr:uncharacterized protein AKAME5_002034100 [Lates japonicus]